MEEKKDWKEGLQDIINREIFKEDLMIQIKSLVEQELDRAREEGEVEERVWDMLEREEDGYIKEISNYWQKNGHKHIEIEIVPNEPDEPEKVYVDPIVPNFTEELSWPVEYKTRKQVKEMFKDTPEEWEERFAEFFLYVTNDKNWVDGRPEWKGDVFVTLYNAILHFIEKLLDEKEREAEENLLKRLYSAKSKKEFRDMLDKLLSKKK